jgi:hypothetical protein
MSIPNINKEQPKEQSKEQPKQELIEVKQEKVKFYILNSKGEKVLVHRKKWYYDLMKKQGRAYDKQD